jgi:hypothetical protein
MYAVQEIYYALAEVYCDWADREYKPAREGGKTLSEGSELYLKALAWVEECISIRQRFGLGKDSGKPELLLSQLLFQLDEIGAPPEGAVDRSVEAARNAYATAERNHDIQMQVFASAALARALIKAGQPHEAFEVLKHCKQSVPEEKFALMRAEMIAFFIREQQHH